MIAVDSSSLIAYLQGDTGNDVTLITQLAEDSQLILPPVVISELLSDPKLPKPIAQTITILPTLSLLPDYWLRTGVTRAMLLKKKLKARLADSLIAQSCIDHKTPLLTRDKDFRHFEKHCGLKLI